MASQALEQMLGSVPRMGQEDRAYQTLDVYTSGLTQMYTGPMKPVGPGPLPMSGPAPMDQPGQFTNRYGPLVERIDLSHGMPHVNYDLYGVNKKTQRGLFGDQYNNFHRKDLW